MKTLFTVFALLSLVACKDKGGSDSGGAEETGEISQETGNADELAIVGTYTDNWGGTHEITSDQWVQGDSTYAIESFNNVDMHAIALNGSGNAYNPDLYSRFDWTWDSSDQLWYCQTAYAAATAEEAEATAAADPADPSTTGCGGFSWTQLIPS